MTVEVLCDNRDAVGESPLWSTAERAMYWVDIEGRRLRRWSSATGLVTSWPTQERLACIALHAAGGLIAGMDTGFYRQDEVIDPRDPVRPDGLYGLSKAFGENLAQLYWDRYRIETVSLRIGSAFAAPKDRRMLATWMSFDDTERLVVAALTAPVVGHSVIYGMSDNSTSWWDNTPAKHLGYRPKDSSDVFRAEVEARVPVLDANDPAVTYQGGAFVRTGPFE